MRHVNHACVGDQTYGRGNDRANHFLRRQFLHSWRVCFDHPVTRETILLKDALPDDLRAILEELGPYSMGRTAVGEDICPQLGLA